MGRASFLLWASIGIALAVPAAAQPLATPLAPEKPVRGDLPKLGAPPPGAPAVADLHVSSVDLGYDKGVARPPARP